MTRRDPLIVSVDGSAPDVVIDYVIPYFGVSKAWSPDGTFIQVTPQDETGGSSSRSSGTRPPVPPRRAMGSDEFPDDAAPRP